MDFGHRFPVIACPLEISVIRVLYFPLSKRLFRVRLSFDIVTWCSSSCIDRCLNFVHRRQRPWDTHWLLQSRIGKDHPSTDVGLGGHFVSKWPQNNLLEISWHCITMSKLECTPSVETMFCQFYCATWGLTLRYHNGSVIPHTESVQGVRSENIWKTEVYQAVPCPAMDIPTNITVCCMLLLQYVESKEWDRKMKWF